MTRTTGLRLHHPLIFFVAVGVLGALLANETRAAAAESVFGRYRALVIGIDDYRNMTPLKTAVNDAATVHAVLQKKYGFESELLTNPDRYTLVRKLDELRAKVEPNDNLLLYFAGHGFLDREADEGFWLPVDAEEDSQANWVAVSAITRTLRAMVAKHVLVISDSCYSGTLTRNAPVRLQTGGDRVLELKRLSEKRARKALTSGGLEPVVDGGRNDGHSVFSGALIDVLHGSHDPIDGFTLYTRLRHSVVVNAEQTPSYGDIRLSGDEGGDFVFVPMSAKAVLEPGSPSASASAASGPVRSPERSATSFDADLAFWETIKDSDSADDYAAYLKQFPEGVFAELAKSRMARATQSPDSAPPSDEPAASDDTPIALAPGVEPVEVEPMSGDYVAVSKTNVRTGPGSAFQMVRSVDAGATLSVTGKVPGKNWVQLSEGGTVIGYAYFVGLRPAAAVAAARQQRADRAKAESAARARAAAEERERRAEEQAAYQRYLDAQHRKEAYELERERVRRSYPYNPYWHRRYYRQ